MYLLQEDVKFPSRLTEGSTSILSGLLQKNPSKRYMKKYYPHLNSTIEFSYRKGVKLKLYKVFRKKTSKFYFSLNFFTV